ncbi:hypothetical protein Prudu_022231, partial [Prunus dulcis]
ILKISGKVHSREKDASSLQKLLSNGLGTQSNSGIGARLLNFPGSIIKPIFYRAWQSENMSASSLVAEAVWKAIESTGSERKLKSQFSFYVVRLGRRRIPEEGGCKHQLAARLASSLGACIEVKVSDEQLALLLSKL